MPDDPIKPDQPQPGSPEYDAQKAAEFDKRSDPANFEKQSDPGVTNDPAPLPEGGQEKFYNAETGEYNWEAHAKELAWKAQQKGEQGDDPDPETPEGDEASNDDNESDDGEVKDVVERAGLTVDELRTQIIQTGEIDAEAKAKLIEQGIPEMLVDEYVELAKHRIESNQTAAYDYAGGQETWASVDAWAAENLSDSEKAHYNELLSGPDWKVAVDTLKSKYAAATPGAREGNFAGGSGGGNGGSAVGFRTAQEQSAALNDPRYRADPEYRRQVQQRLAATQSFEYTERF